MILVIAFILLFAILDALCGRHPEGTERWVRRIFG